MSYAMLVQLCVAAVAALGGVFVLFRRAASEAAVYRHRIAGTMLVAFGLALAVLAIGLDTAGGLD